MTTIRYAVFAKDKVRDPQVVWAYPLEGKKEKGMVFGPPSEGVHYNGERLVAFGSFDYCVRFHGRMERWEYANGEMVKRQCVSRLREEQRLADANREH